MEYRVISTSPRPILAVDFPGTSSDKRQPILFAALMVMLIVMNAIDGLLTIFWVTTARAVEYNPLMALLLDIHPALFMGIKCALVSLGAILLLRHREHMLAVLSLATVCAVYVIVLTHHWQMILMLIV